MGKEKVFNCNTVNIRKLVPLGLEELLSTFCLFSTSPRSTRLTWLPNSTSTQYNKSKCPDWFKRKCHSLQFPWPLILQDIQLRFYMCKKIYCVLWHRIRTPPPLAREYHWNIIYFYIFLFHIQCVHLSKPDKCMCI